MIRSSILQHNIQIKLGLKAKLSILFIVCSNKIWNCVLLSGKGNDNGEQTTIGLISKKASNCKCSALFCTFHCLCFSRLQRETSRNFRSWLYVLWRKCPTCLVYFFPHCRSFSPRWPLAFIIFSPPLQNFMLFLQEKCLFCCFFSLPLSLFLVGLRWHVALRSLFLCLFLFLYPKFVDMTINLSLIL